MRSDWGSQDARGGATGGMTAAGTIGKTAFLLVLLVLSGATTAMMMKTGDEKAALVAAIVGLVVALVAGLIGCCWRRSAVVTGPVFAIGYGLGLGAVCVIVEASHRGAVVFAAIGTVAVSVSMITLFALGARVGTKLGFLIVSALFALLLLEFASLGLKFAGVNVPALHSANPITIAISAGAVLIGAGCLLWDFTEIEAGIARGDEKHLEWYFAFGVTLSLLIIFVRLIELYQRIDEYTDGALSTFFLSMVGAGGSGSSSSDDSSSSD